MSKPSVVRWASWSAINTLTALIGSTNILIRGGYPHNQPAPRQQTPPSRLISISGAGLMAYNGSLPKSKGTSFVGDTPRRPTHPDGTPSDSASFVYPSHPASFKIASTCWSNPAPHSTTWDRPNASRFVE